MLGRTEILFKWLLYAAGVLICWMLHGVALQFLDKAVKQVGLTAFSYYCWGCALVSIALFLCI